LTLFAIGVQANCTTIIFRRDHSRILIATDTRGDTATGHVIGGVGPFSHEINDSKCKIVILGRTGFSVTGAIDYSKDQVHGDILDNWDALDDAKASFALYGDSAKLVGEEWARRSVDHYSTFYRVAPDRVAAIADSNSHVLEIGLFFSWVGDKPQLIIEVIGFNPPPQLVPVFSSEDIREVDETELATDGNTNELIEGQSERAEASFGRWESEKRKFTSQDLVWRHLQFLIKETSKIDSTVSPESDILEVPLRGKPNWIVAPACQK
jgi:hypothetical protein